MFSPGDLRLPVLEHVLHRRGGDRADLRSAQVRAYDDRA